MLTGTVRFVIAPGHPHYGKKLVVLGGVKFKNGTALVTAEDAAKIEPILVHFNNVGIEGSAQHDEFVRLYAGAAPDKDGKKLSVDKAKKAIAEAHEQIQQEKLDALMAAAMGDAEDEEELAEIAGVRSGTKVVPGGSVPQGS